eukprot:gene12081-2203_t
MVGVFEAHPEPTHPLTQRTVPPNKGFEVYTESMEKAEEGLLNAVSLVPGLQECGIKRQLHGDSDSRPATLLLAVSERSGHSPNPNKHRDCMLVPHYAGPDTHSADHSPVMGRTPGVDNMFVATGFNSHGIQTGAGVGKAIAEWILHGRPQSFRADFNNCDIGRSAAPCALPGTPSWLQCRLGWFPQQLASDRAWVQGRALEGYATGYDVHYPFQEWVTGRNVKLSPFHDILSEVHLSSGSPGPLTPAPSVLSPENRAPLGLAAVLWREAQYLEVHLDGKGPRCPSHAFMTAILSQFFRAPDQPLSAYGPGWDPGAIHATGGGEALSYRHNKAPWVGQAAQEHHACRQAAALFDMSSFGKLLLSGTGAAEAVDWIFCSPISSKPNGSVVYTLMLNRYGGIASDVTVLKRSVSDFYITTAAGKTLYDKEHIRRNLPSSVHGNVQLEDLSEEFAVLAFMGPLSRHILAQLVSPEALDDHHFPFSTGQTLQLHVGGGKQVPVSALRVSFVGELGWEFHIPKSEAVQVYSALMTAAADLGHPEKGFVHYGHDITTLDTPLESGLSFCVNKRLAESGSDFLGKNALLLQKEKGVDKKMLYFTVDDPCVSLWHNEAIFMNGDPVGLITSGGLGHTVNK